MGNGSQARSDETTQSESSLNKKRDIHKELSNTVRRTMFAMLAYSASCAVIMAQPDVPFVLTSSGVKIPVINVAVNLKAFLVVGPLVLTAITAYLHLFLSKLDGIGELEEYDKQQFIFNFKDKFSRSVRFLIFYATPPIVMLGFSWKSAVLRTTGDSGINAWPSMIHFAAMVMTVGMLILYFKPRLKVRWLVICGIVALATMAFFSIVLGTYFRRGLNLKGADLSKVKFRELNLTNSDLRYANLSKADLKSNIMRFADMSEADMSEADLRNADLFNADLKEADLSEADLSEANLNRANLSKADLSEAKLIGARLIKADLSGADLRNAELFNADLKEADLSGADLRNAELFNADLKEADLSGADLSKTDLLVSQLCNANTLVEVILESKKRSDAKEKCPEKFSRPKEP